MKILIDGKYGLRPTAIIGALLPLCNSADAERICLNAWSAARELHCNVIYREENRFFDVQCSGTEAVDSTALKAIMSRHTSDPAGIAFKALKVLSEAETYFHGSTTPHFHEARNVGILYTVLSEVLGALDGELTVITPIHTGKGKISFSHGTFKLPAPAAAHIIEKYDLNVLYEGEGELLTPAGAALTACLPSCDSRPEDTTQVVGADSISKQVMYID